VIYLNFSHIPPFIGNETQDETLYAL
jgi:hypothetical protein